MQETDELREHYNFDYSQARPNRFADRLSEETIVVVLEPDVAAVFPTADAVNQALRGLIATLGSLAGTPDLMERIRSSAIATAPQL